MCRNFPGRQGKEGHVDQGTLGVKARRQARVFCVWGMTGSGAHRTEEAGYGELGVNVLGKLGLAAFPSRGGC